MERVSNLISALLHRSYSSEAAVGDIILAAAGGFPRFFACFASREF